MTFFCFLTVSTSVTAWRVYLNSKLLNQFIEIIRVFCQTNTLSAECMISTTEISNM